MEKMNMIQKVNDLRDEIVADIINQMKTYGVNSIMMSEIGLGGSPIVIGNNDSTDQNYALDHIILTEDGQILFEISCCWEEETVDADELGIYNLAILADYLKDNKDDITGTDSNDEPELEQEEMKSDDAGVVTTADRIAEVMSGKEAEMLDKWSEWFTRNSVNLYFGDGVALNRSEFLGLLKQVTAPLFQELKEKENKIDELEDKIWKYHCHYDGRDY